MNSRALWPIGELIVGNQSFRIHVRLKGPAIRNSRDSPELEKNILQEHAELSRYYISSVFFFYLVYVSYCSSAKRKSHLSNI